MLSHHRQTISCQWLSRREEKRTGLLFAHTALCQGCSQAACQKILKELHCAELYRPTAPHLVYVRWTELNTIVEPKVSCKTFNYGPCGFCNIAVNYHNYCVLNYNSTMWRNVYLWTWGWCQPVLPSCQRPSHSDNAMTLFAWAAILNQPNQRRIAVIPRFVAHRWKKTKGRY